MMRFISFIFSGLVMIDKKKIGMMWVEDED